MLGYNTTALVSVRICHVTASQDQAQLGCEESTLLW